MRTWQPPDAGSQRAPKSSYNRCALHLVGEGPLDNRIALGRRVLMQLRQHPKMIGRWPPKQSVSGFYAGTAPPPTRPPLPQAAVLHRLADCPPLPQPTSAQGIILYTDQGTAVIVTTGDTIFREHLFQQLQACLGLSLQEIGDVDIDF